MISSLVPQLRVLDGRKVGGGGNGGREGERKDWGEEEEMDEVAWQSVMTRLQALAVKEEEEEKEERWRRNERRGGRRNNEKGLS